MPLATTAPLGFSRSHPSRALGPAPIPSSRLGVRIGRYPWAVAAVLADFAARRTTGNGEGSRPISDEFISSFVKLSIED